MYNPKLRVQSQNKTKILTTYRIVSKPHQHENNTNATSHFEYKPDIQILATLKELFLDNFYEVLFVDKVYNVN